MSTKIDLTKKIKVLDENSQLTSDVNQINFIGAGVTATTSGNDVTVNISGTPIGGGASISYYLNGGTNQGTFVGNTYYEMSKIPVVGTNADFSIGADGYVADFITDAGDPGLLVIPAGNWNFEMYFNASSSGGTPGFYVELYKYDGISFSLIASSVATPEGITNGTVIDAYFTSLAVPQTTLTLTDRLAVRVYVIHSGRTITLHTQGSHLCQIVTTFSTGISSLNGLTAQTQTLSTGTTGTDFGISSSGSTHTLNLPTASATNTGKLSSTDWSTFNNKVSTTRSLTINGTTQDLSADRTWSVGTVTSVGATGPITSSGGAAPTISTSMNTNKLIGRSTAGIGVMEEITVGTGLTLSAGTLSATSASGVWGISDTSGVYTYYATLTLAMASASAGQVIELFADVTESSNVTISLKHGVNIYGNGHTYNYTNNSGTVFTCATSGAVVGTIIIENLNIVRTNTASTGASIFTFTGSSGFATTKLYLPGSFVTYTVTSGNSPVITATDSLNALIVDGLFCITNGAGTAVTCNTAVNSYIECTGTSTAFSSGTIRNSRITTTSGTGVSLGTAISCVISCTTSGVGVNEGNASNSIINTNTGNAMQAGSTIAEGSASNCTVSSTSGICFRRVIPSNCVASSGSNLVVDHWFNYGGARFHRNYFGTTSTSPVFACAGGTMELVDSTIIQNGTGPGVRVTGASNQDVINCTVIVASAAANCLNATAASNSRYINNKFKGATTPVSANVTQTVTNTIDNQGNILL